MKFPYKISGIGMDSLQELSKHDDYISAYQVGKTGILRKSFVDNVDELIYYNFVKVKQKEFGKQTRKYYKITQLGLEFLEISNKTDKEKGSEGTK